MKRFPLFFACTAALLSLSVSCVKEADIADDARFVVDFNLDDVEKTSLGASDGSGFRKVFWSDGDVINLNGMDSEPLTGIGASATSASFVFAASADFPYKAFYPASFCGTGSQITLPASQTYTAGTFATSTAPLIGYCAKSGDSWIMKNGTAIVKLSLKKGSTSSPLYKVFFCGRNHEQVCGTFAVDYQNATLSGTDKSRSAQSVCMNCAGVELTTTGVELYFSVPATEFTKGFRVRVIDSANNYQDIYRNSAITLQRGKLYGMSAVTFTPSGTTTTPDSPGVIEEFSGGSGTSADPFVISTSEDLVNLAYAIEAANTDYKLKYYSQSADIDMSEVDGFSAIGKTTTNNFRGKYYGNNHKISNLNIVQTGTSDQPAGLFGNCGTGTLVSDLVLDSPSVKTAGSKAGSVAAHIYKGTVKNCHVTNGNVYSTGKDADGYSRMGGIVGIVEGSTIQNCIYEGTVFSSTNHCGGIAGKMSSAGKILDCSFRGDVTASYYTGGIVADMFGSSVVDGCVFDGKVSSKEWVAGGVAAYPVSGTISNCAVSGRATVRARQYYAGGIVGALASNSTVMTVSIDKCVCYGTVSGTHSVGGIIGYITDKAGSNVSIKNSAVIGATLTATGKNSSSYALLGGLIGWDCSNGTLAVSNCCVTPGDFKSVVVNSGGVAGFLGYTSRASSYSNSYSAVSGSDILYQGAGIGSASMSYKGSFLGRATAAATFTNCYAESTFGFGYKGSETRSGCNTYTATQFTDGTVLAVLNGGGSNWEASASGYPVPKGLKADPNPLPVAKKRVSIIGDSISTFAGWMQNGYTTHYPNANNCDVDRVDKTWWYRLVYNYMTDARLDMNLSFSNSTVTQNTCGDATQYWYGHDFCSRYIECAGMGRPDVIIIHGGTNDFAHNYGEKLGGTVAMRSAKMPSDEVMNAYYSAADACTTLDQAKALDYGTFCSSYIKLLKMMQIQYPSAKIVCLIGDYYGTSDYPAIRDCILHIVNHYSSRCKVVDFVALNGWKCQTAPFSKYSGSHPDAAGMDYMAKTIYNQVGAWID